MLSLGLTREPGSKVTSASLTSDLDKEGISVIAVRRETGSLDMHSNAQRFSSFIHTDSVAIAP